MEIPKGKGVSKGFKVCTGKYGVNWDEGCGLGDQTISWRECGYCLEQCIAYNLNILEKY